MMITIHTVDLAYLKRFQSGYFYSRPMVAGEWLVMSSLVVARGMAYAHLGLRDYLNSFDCDD